MKVFLQNLMSSINIVSFGVYCIFIYYMRCLSISIYLRSALSCFTRVQTCGLLNSTMESKIGSALRAVLYQIKPVFLRRFVLWDFTLIFSLRHTVFHNIAEVIIYYHWTHQFLWKNCMYNSHLTPFIFYFIFLFPTEIYTSTTNNKLRAIYSFYSPSVILFFFYKI